MDMDLKKFKLSERAQVVLILVAIVAAFALAWWFYVGPMIQTRAEIQRLRTEIANNPIAKFSIGDLKTAEEVAKKDAAALDRDWLQTINRLTTLSNISSTPSHVDFQVIYAATRRSLGTRAVSLGITLPPTFDIPPAVTSQEVVRERLNQLKTVEKLLDLVFNQHIRGITSFKNLPTVLHYDNEQKLICEEYPVEVDFTTPFESLFYLFSGIFEEEQIFVFSKIRVTSDPKIEGILHIKAVMSSLVFP